MITKVIQKVDVSLKGIRLECTYGFLNGKMERREEDKFVADQTEIKDAMRYTNC